MFQAVRFFSPSKVKDIQPVASDIDSLCVVPFLKDPTTIANQKNELPSYLAKAADVSPSIELLSWWKQYYKEDLPSWCSCLKKVLLIQPSSAAAERVFSLLNNFFSNRQHNSLEDYVEASLLL